MPLYEYKCSSCGHQQEFLQKWRDAPLTVCSACGKETFVKQLTAAGFQLKGSGWYATDFRGSGNGAAKPDVKGGDTPAAAPQSEPAAPAATPDAASGGGTTPAAGCGSSCACH